MVTGGFKNLHLNYSVPGNSVDGKGNKNFY